MGSPEPDFDRRLRESGVRAVADDAGPRRRPGGIRLRHQRRGAVEHAVYVNGDTVGTPQTYSQQASEIAALGQSDDFLNVTSAQDTAWVPLGSVRGLHGGRDDVGRRLPAGALNPNGAVRGNYHNRKSDQVEAMYGSVDKQDAAGGVDDRDGQVPGV